MLERREVARSGPEHDRDDEEVEVVDEPGGDELGREARAADADVRLREKTIFGSGCQIRATSSVVSAAAGSRSASSSQESIVWYSRRPSSCALCFRTRSLWKR